VCAAPVNVCVHMEGGVPLIYVVGVCALPVRWTDISLSVCSTIGPIPLCVSI